MKTASLLSLCVLLLSSAPLHATECKSIRATLDEMQATTGCNPGRNTCFLGVVSGNHQLRGTTHFGADGYVSQSPGTSPGFNIYSGPFEYRTDEGNLYMRETGVTGATGASTGVVTAYQQIVSGTGKFEGATGYLFVSGLRDSGLITTEVSGEICLP